MPEVEADAQVHGRSGVRRAIAALDDVAMLLLADPPAMAAALLPAARDMITTLSQV